MVELYLHSSIRLHVVVLSYAQGQLLLVITGLDDERNSEVRQRFEATDTFGKIITKILTKF
jgi:hypothetical protein